MKQTIQTIIAVAIIVGMAGCASTEAYFADRGRDTMDIATFAIGKGGGATAKLGPIHAGLFFGVEHVGLRGGEVNLAWTRDKVTGGLIDPLIFIPTPEGPSFGADEFKGIQRLYDWRTDAEFSSCMNKLGGPYAKMAWARGKKYYYDGVCPFIMLPSQRFMQLAGHGDRYPAASLFQVDLAIGAYYTIRVGANPAELVDFCLGWLGIDIFGDDVGAKTLTDAKSNERLKAMAKPTP